MPELDYRLVLDSFADAVLACDGSGRLVYANPAAERLLGWPAGELISQPFTALMAPRLRGTAATGFGHYLATPQAKPLARSIRVPLLRRDGSEIDVELSLTASRTAEGHDLVVAVVHDRREQPAGAEAERAAFLAEASTVLAASLDYASTLASVARLAVPRLADWAAVHMLEPDGSIRQLAVAHVDPAKVAFAWELDRRYPTDPRAPYAIPQVIRSGRPELFADLPEEILLAYARDAEHLKLLRQLGLKSYLVVPLLARGRTLGTIGFAFAESGRRYGPDELALAEDLARRAASAVDNARLYREAQDAIRLRDQFLAVASHELRTPISPIQLQIQMLLRTARSGTLDKQPPGRLLTMLETCDRQVRQLVRLVNDLLDVSRIAAGRLEVKLQQVDLAQLVGDVATRFRPELKQAGCTLVLHADQPVLGRWDPLRLDQVVTNLLANAIKYGPGKPITVTVEADARTARLTVRDEGIGIAAEHQQRIYERFERAVSEQSYGGLGLGLFIAREIVRALGGSIRLQSELGKGSTFTVELARQPGPEGRDP